VAIYEIEFTASGWDTSTPPKRIKDATFVQPVLNRLSLNASLAVGTPLGTFTQAGISDDSGPQPLAVQDHETRELPQYLGDDPPLLEYRSSRGLALKRRARRHPIHFLAWGSWQIEQH
jgi:hypothetical protein